MSAVKQMDQAAVCRRAMALVEAGDWAGVVDLTAEGCAKFPDSMALVGTRMNGLYHLRRVDAAVDAGLDYLGRFPEAEKIMRNLWVMLPSATVVDRGHLAGLARLEGEMGRALYVCALVKNRRGVDAERVYWELEAAFPMQALLSRSGFATQLAAESLYEVAERVSRIESRDQIPTAAAVSSRVEILLKLVIKGQPERFGEAKQLAEALLKRSPDSPDAWYAIGRVWWEASRMDLSLAHMRRFVGANPRHPIRGGVTFNSIYDESLSEDALFQTHREWASTLMDALPRGLPSLEVDYAAERRLRVGYVSSDFGCHPVGYFTISTLPFHDQSNYEVFIYSQREPAHQDDPLSQEFRACVGESNWRWVRSMEARQLFDQIREDRIDVLVDLAGHTTGNRIEVFGMRAAPVQVSWLGYPHSTGMEAIDYRMSDSIVEPEGACERWSTESIYRLPRGFHAIRMSASVPEPSAPPCVKNGYLTFGSFNNVNKMGPETIRVWAMLLRGIPDARLVLKHKTLDVFENREGLRSLFACEGVDPKRLRFLGTTPNHGEHFACYSQMDIALDPVGYNGTTTTCEALYMGVPVLTLPGRKHAARVSASLLHRVGLEGWVASDEAQYLRIGRYASKHFDVLAARRHRLREDFLASPLNDGPGLARELETAYRFMWKQACLKAQADFK